MNPVIPKDAPKVRLCCLKIWEDFNGYGLHFKVANGDHIVIGIDSNSPAGRAGLKVGDLIVEVNGHNIDRERYHKEFKRIMKMSKSVSLLVLDPACVAYYKERQITVRGDMPNVLSMICPDTSAGVANTRSDKLKVRLCFLKKWIDFSGYGFDLNVTKEEPSLIISGLVNNSPAGRTGLKLGDRIVEVNGNNVEGESNLKVVHKILKKSDSVWLLMLDAAAVAYYKERNITVRGDMSNVVTTYCPDTSEGIATSLISGVCAYKMMCAEFKESLNISGDYFDFTFDKCYCTTCHAKSGDEKFYTRGNPPKIYSVPVGWCRFAIRTGARAKDLDVFTKWHTAYHGTFAESVASILRAGNIFSAGTDVLDCSQLRERPGHYNDDYKPGGFDTKRVFVSPSVVYSGCDVYAKSTSFVSPSTGDRYSAKTVLNVCIKPGSYEVSGSTISAKNVDPLFLDSDLEWSTKTHGAIIVYGLLIKLTALRSWSEIRTAILNAASD